MGFYITSIKFYVFAVLLILLSGWLFNNLRNIVHDLGNAFQAYNTGDAPRFRRETGFFVVNWVFLLLAAGLFYLLYHYRIIGL